MGRKSLAKWIFRIRMLIYKDIIKRIGKYPGVCICISERHML